MRISDWSSDVCSSDLDPDSLNPVDGFRRAFDALAHSVLDTDGRCGADFGDLGNRHEDSSHWPGAQPGIPPPGIGASLPVIPGDAAKGSRPALTSRIPAFQLPLTTDVRRGMPWKPSRRRPDFSVCN